MVNQFHQNFLIEYFVLKAKESGKFKAYCLALIYRAWVGKCINIWRWSSC